MRGASLIEDLFPNLDGLASLVDESFSTSVLVRFLPNGFRCRYMEFVFPRCFLTALFFPDPIGDLELV